MYEPLHAGTLRSQGQALGGLDVHGLKCLSSALEVKTDGVHGAIRTVEHTGDRSFIVDIGRNRLRLRTVDARWPMIPARTS
jgi:hypothetical protein